MRNLIIALLSLLIFSSNLNAQSSITDILESVEQNNTMLSALRKSGDAEKIGNRTDLFLANPEVEFAYLWGSPSVIGNRKNLSITQSFDFPTAYKYRNQIAKLKNNQLEMEYRKELKAILLHTRLICSDLIYTNALKEEVSKRVDHARRIADSYKSKFDLGDSNILEYNKAQLNHLNLLKELETIDIERTALLMKLKGLNGGVAVDFKESVFKTLHLPVDFKAWFALAEESNPILKWLAQELTINQKQEKLSRAQALPKITAGYTSEALTTEQFKGVVVGLSLPLWENKNKVKYAKAQTAALQSIQNDQKLQFYNQLNALFVKATSLNRNLEDYRSSLLLFNSSDLLIKALDKGEISLIEYILELSVYYESVNKVLEMERDLNQTIAELNQFM